MKVDVKKSEYGDTWYRDIEGDILIVSVTPNLSLTRDDLMSMLGELHHAEYQGLVKELREDTKRDKASEADVPPPTTDLGRELEARYPPPTWKDELLAAAEERRDIDEAEVYPDMDPDTCPHCGVIGGDHRTWCGTTGGEAEARREPSVVYECGCEHSADNAPTNCPTHGCRA